jgi:hypothetical protein
LQEIGRLGYATKGLRTEYSQWVESDEASASSRSNSCQLLMLCHLKSKKLEQRVLCSLSAYSCFRGGERLLG